MIKTGPSFSNGGGVGKHTNSTLNLGKISSRNDGRWLVVDTDLETGWAPVNELDGTLGLDGGNGSIDVLWNDITSVKETASHVLSVTRVTFNHLVGWLKARVGDFSDSQLFVVSLFSRNDWSIGDQRKVDTWVRYQVGLELGQINVEGTVESKGGSDGGDDLSNQSVQVGVGRPFNVKVASANVIDGLVINHESTVRVFKGGVGGQDGVVRFDDSGGNLRSRVDGEFELGLLSVVNRETFEQESTETGTSSSSKGVEDEETLKTSAVIGEFTDSVKDKVDDFLSDGVVTTSIVVGSIFLSGDQLFRVEELTVGTGTDFVNDSWLKIDKDGTWDVLSGTSFREKGVEGVVTATDGLVRRHLTVRLDTVFYYKKEGAGVGERMFSGYDKNPNIQSKQKISTFFAGIKSN